MSGFRFEAMPEPATALRPELTDEQRSVLAAAEGASFAVIGPPGCGKTTALLALLEQRVLRYGGPESVLVLAPNRAVATALRERAAELLGRPSQGPLVRSTDSYAYRRVAAAAVAAGAAAPRLLTGPMQDEIIAELLAGEIEDGRGGAWPEALGPEVRLLPAFRTELRELLMRMAQLGIGPEGLRALGAERGRPEWVAAAGFAAEYRAVLGLGSADAGGADTGDQELRDSAELLAEAAMLVAGTGAEGVRLVLVDDAQELTAGQRRLLAAFPRAGVPVIAFGTPDIAAGAHRGARPETLGLLADALEAESAAVAVLPPVLLTAVHRGAGAAAGLVRAIAGHIGVAAAPGQRADPLVAARGSSRVRALIAPSGQAESAAVARLLREQRLRLGVPWRRMAVVLRSQGQLAAWRHSLAAAEVPVQRAGGGRALLDDVAARDLVRIVRAGLGAPPDGALAAELLLGPYGGLDPVALRRLRLALRREELAGGGGRPGAELLAEAIAAPGRMASLEGEHGLAPARLAGRLARTIEAVRAAGAATAEELLWIVWERSGLAERWQRQSAEGGPLGDEADERLDAVVALFAAAKRFVERLPGAPALLFFSELERSPLAEDTLAPVARFDAVVLTTPSGLVGAEYEVVVLAGVQEGVWPNPRVRGGLLHPDDFVAAAEGIAGEPLDGRRHAVEGELRMAALAVSRATRLAVLSAVEDDEQRASALLRLAERFDERFDAEGEGLDDAARRNAGAAAATMPLDLRGMVGELRRELAAAAEPGGHPAAAALARLAAGGVPGAAPEQWLGLQPWSDPGPIHDLEEGPMPVSPSDLEGYRQSPAHWFLRRIAGGSPGLAAAVGTLIHAAMEQVAQDSSLADAPERLWAAVEQRWQELRFEAPWIEQLELTRARRKVDGVAAYLRDFAAEGGALRSAEQRFELRVGGALLRGSIDRVESVSGGVMITDLKTGDRVLAVPEAAAHPQLSAYQLAAASGGLESVPQGERIAGARLLFVGVRGQAAAFVLRAQPALDPDGRAEVAAEVAAAAAGMASGRYWAPVELPYGSPLDRYEWRIQFVPEVPA